MKIDLLYGHDGLCVDFPDDSGLTVIRKHAMTPLADPTKGVEQALSEALSGEDS